MHRHNGNLCMTDIHKVYGVNLHRGSRMRRSRNRSRKTNVLKVVIGILLLGVVVYGTSVFLTQKDKADTRADIQKGNTDNQTASAVKTPEATKKPENPTLNKKSANIYVSNTFTLKVKDTTEAVTYQSSDEAVATVSDEGVVKGVGKGKAVITAMAGSVSLTCDVNVKKSKLIALTFDDGPGQYEPIILDALEKYNAKATFFVVGQNINETTSEYLKREVELGCEVGNHSYTHPNFQKIGVAKVKKEIKETNAAIEKATGKKATLCRAPYGGYLQSVKDAINMPQIIWNVDTLDWKYRNTNRIVNYVLENAKDGDVVLMHSIHKSTVDGVERIVKGLQDKGFELVTVSELAAAKNTKLQNHKIYGCF